MHTLLQDLRFSARLLMRRPGFTTLIVACVALGIGANTALFSVISAVIFRPLPFDDPDQLAVLAGTRQGEIVNSGMVSYAELEDYRARSESFEEIGALRATTFTLTGLEHPERVFGTYVTANFFSLLGCDVSLGRMFLPDEDSPGAPNVAILSDGSWQRRFGGDEQIIGRKLVLDGVSHTVVGVLPAGFDFPIDVRGAEIWIPTATDAATFQDRGGPRVKVMGRLMPEATPAQTQEELDAIAAGLAREYPAWNAGRGIELISLRERVVGDTRRALLLLFGAVGVVLLIACANVANLLLARSEDRRGELALRAALGAGRGRLMRQLLTESVLLSTLGGLVGLLLAFWGIEAIRALTPARMLSNIDIEVDIRVLAFTCAIALVTGLLFGLPPALRFGRLDLHSALKQVGQAATARRLPWQRGLVVSEVALALTLLVGAGLLIRSLQRLINVDPGFEPANVLAFQMSVPRAGFGDPGRRAELYQRVLERLEALPGVQSVGASTTLPLHPAYNSTRFQIEGRPQPDPENIPAARFDSISPAYFDAMGLPLVRGRTFADLDRVGQPGVAIINQTMARRFWPDEDPIGQRLLTGAPLNDGSPGAFEIVGIVGGLRDTRLDAPLQPYMYVPFQQQALRFMCFALRSRVEPHELVPAVRREVAVLASNEAPFEFATMAQYFERSVRPRRFPTLVLSAFAGLALILAALGVYGTLSHSIAQRTHEFGIRTALGARRSDVLRLVFKQGFGLVGTGIGIGLLVSLASTRAMASHLFEISSVDPVTFAGVALLLIAVAALACYLPARRATKVDPIVALRCE